MSQQYFVVGDVRNAGDDVHVVGQFIVDGEVVASGSTAKAAKARIKPVEPFQVKWVLGPGGLGGDMARAMGYETVAYDDLRYPPPRT